ncbi:hypothetical protein LTR70_009281, partial [Exophiala xenobiotica]
RSWQDTRAPYVDTAVLESLFIARASFCCNERATCPVPTIEPHLVIHYDQVPITNTFGAAISYTWGEFERRQILIGHEPLHSGLGGLVWV